MLLAILDSLAYFLTGADRPEFISNEDTYYIISNTVFNRFKWIIMYYFVIKVNSLVVKLKSKDNDEYLEQTRIWKCRKITIYILLITFQVGIATCRIVDRIVHLVDKSKQQEDEYMIIQTVFKTAMLIMDIYMFILFIGILKFYSQARINAIKQGEKKYNKNSVNDTFAEALP